MFYQDITLLINKNDLLLKKPWAIDHASVCLIYMGIKNLNKFNEKQVIVGKKSHFSKLCPKLAKENIVRKN